MSHAHTWASRYSDHIDIYFISYQYTTFYSAQWHILRYIRIYLNCLIERLVARIFYEIADILGKKFFLVIARVNLITFILKKTDHYIYILVCIVSKNGNMKLRAIVAIRSGVCKGVCMRVFSSFTRKWKCLCDATRLFRMRNIRIERGQPLWSPSSVPSREKSIYFVAVRSARFSLMKFRPSSMEDLYDGTNHRTVLSYKLRADAWLSPNVIWRMALLR